MFMYCSYYSNNTRLTRKPEEILNPPLTNFFFLQLNILFSYPSRILHVKTVKLDTTRVVVLTRRYLERKHISKWISSPCEIAPVQIPRGAEPVWALSGTAHWLCLHYLSEFNMRISCLTVQTDRLQSISGTHTAAPEHEHHAFPELIHAYSYYLKYIPTQPHRHNCIACNS